MYTDFTFAKKNVIMKCTHECEGPTTFSAIVPLPFTDDKRSDCLTKIAKDEACTPSCRSFIGRTPCMTTVCTLVPLQILFKVKTPGTQLHTIVMTGKGEHAQFNKYTALLEHLEERNSRCMV